MAAVVRPTREKSQMHSIPPHPQSAEAAPAAQAGPAAAASGAKRNSLLKRYLLPVGLYDEPQGDLFAVDAVRRRNLDRLRRWMPHYARVHGVLALLLLVLCSTADASEISGWVLVAAAVPTAGEVVLAVVFGCVATVLRLGHE